MSSTVAVTLRGQQRIESGHPWIYRADVSDVRAGPGDRVAVVGPRKRPLGHALYSDRSQIALRMLSCGEEAADDALLERRLKAAVAFRETLGIDGSAYRVVHGEADLLPSLVVDRYGDYLVVQALSQGTDRLLPFFVQTLRALLNPRGILARNDSRTRSLEGLDRRVDVLAGEVPEQVVVSQSGVEYSADLWRGQKTGLFLDQRENREAARSYSRGRLLDCFSYHGGFALTLAFRCDETIAVDVSEEAIERLRKNAARNAAAVDARVANVFDALRAFERSGERFDTIVLDPPAFAKSRAAIPKAAAGYKEVNLRALKLLNPGGTLVTCSCSYHIGEADLAAIVHSAAIDARANVAVVEKRMQSRDHPVLLGVPETSYLKCFILRKLA
jgi:23S rRNA (cytosine1962-C5)-methyltransferase